MNSNLPSLSIITFSAPKWEETVNAWRKLFGYKVRETGYLSSELAETWNAINNIDSRFAVLANPNYSDSILIRIIENSHPDNYEPLRSFGWSSINIKVSSLPSLITKLEKYGFEIIENKKSENYNSTNINILHIKGLSEEIVCLSEYEKNISKIETIKSNNNVPFTFGTSLGIRDIERVQNFYYDKFKIHKNINELIEIESINNAFNLPRDTLHSIAINKIANDSIIELHEYPENAIRRPTMANQLCPGVCHISLSIPSLDMISLYWLKEPKNFKEFPYNGKRQATFYGPTGELVELIETNVFE